MLPHSSEEIRHLVTAAMEERADALGEILSQSDEFISYFLNMMTAQPAAYPRTTRVLAIASLVGTFVAMYFKGRYARPRPSQLCPALLPPIEVPGHASFPSGHSTQAHLMALCMDSVLDTLVAEARHGRRSVDAGRSHCQEPRNSGPALSQRYHRGQADRAMHHAIAGFDSDV